MDPGRDLLEGVIERIVFTRAAGPDGRGGRDPYTVARLRVTDPPAAAVRGGGTTTIVGRFSAVAEGDTVRVRGKWGVDKKYGEQFQVEECSLRLPSSSGGILRYLSGGRFKGIGDELARRLVDRFGADTLTVIADQPERLREVEGLGRVRIDR